MTEAEWLACDDWKRMIEPFRGGLRKYRLFCIAWIRLNPLHGPSVADLDITVEHEPDDRELGEMERFLAGPARSSARATDWLPSDRMWDEPVLPGLIRCSIR